MRQPAAQNPFCWRWRPSVRGTLMSHLILGVDSPVPGPGLALSWCAPLQALEGWTAGPSSRGGGGPSFLLTVSVVCAHVTGDRGGQGRVRVLAALTPV